MYNSEDNNLKNNTAESQTESQTEDFSDAFTLFGRNAGCSLKLRGKVVLINFLVSDGDSSWDDESVEAAVRMMKAASKRLMDESGLNKKDLQVAYAYCKVSIPYIVDRRLSSRCVPDVLKLFGYDSVTKYQRHYEEKFSRDETAVSFIFNKDFRSYAHMLQNSSIVEHTVPDGDEYSIVSFNKNDPVDSERTFLHELFHQFGAIDYYYPAKVRVVSAKYMPDSIMCSGNVIDEFTRYLIGWDNELSENSKKFLNEIKDIPIEEFDYARKEEYLRG